MKLKFKLQPFQTDAVNAVADCFQGQPLASPISYRLDPGRPQSRTPAQPTQQAFEEATLPGFRNSALQLLPAELLKNLHAVQLRQNLPLSPSLKPAPGCDLNLDIEMETGTGKTYCYIKSIFELNKRFGWSKFIVVVPSIAIREGVQKSLSITAEHFLEQYRKKARAFIYNSKQLHNLESFSSDGGINVMIINVQAFNARGKDARRIYEELDDFNSRKPIDVIAANRPILILDEPQKMEGAKTVEGLREFNPLFILRYSATHKQQFNKVYRLDALDAYQQKLVKKISVRGIALKGLAGSNAYLYLDSIHTSTAAPIARVELEINYGTGIKRELRVVDKNTNLFVTSKELPAYKGFVVSEIDARDNTLSFTNGVTLQVGEAAGDVNEAALRRIQIREAVKAHFEKEQALFPQGIKVLTLFFIDEVAKYRQYDASAELPGEYAQAFEEEYNTYLATIPLLEDTPYNRHLKAISTRATHAGYFSIDKKSKRLVNPDGAASESTDVDAYDLILKDKERLLSFEEPVRFLFSHSALREGWDNPNVFVICTLKHSDNSVSRRQEVGRGLRLCVNQNGDRIDDPATVHDTNILTVVASESYRDFVAGLQRDIVAGLSDRPRKANKEYFVDKMFKTESADVLVTPAMATAIERYLIKNDYTDSADQITPAYLEARENGNRAPLPAELTHYAEHIFKLIDGVFSEAQLPKPEDAAKAQPNPLNSANFYKQSFQSLWHNINRKAAYTVHFETAELSSKCVAAIDAELKVTPLQYTVQSGEQHQDDAREFAVTSTQTGTLRHSGYSSVKYDLIGKIAELTKLTRNTVGHILRAINAAVFSQYRTNPEDFIRQAARLIKEQTATVIVEHLTYNPIDESYNEDIFTANKTKQDLSKAFKANRHVFDYVFTDSQLERDFVTLLDSGTEVEVYAKLPRTFFIPTPVGDYNPDWAIAFKQGDVKHIYFIAETKGSISTMELRKIEAAKIDCAQKFFAKITNNQIKYGVVKSYEKLMELVK